MRKFVSYYSQFRKANLHQKFLGVVEELEVTPNSKMMLTVKNEAQNTSVLFVVQIRMHDALYKADNLVVVPVICDKMSKH